MGGIVTAKPLLSRPQQILYGRLVRAFPGRIILAQVALSRLLAGDRPRNPDGPAAAPRFRHLIVDFVVCKSDFEAVAVIEFDGRSHPRAAQSEKDRRKDLQLSAAGIKMIRVSARDIPDELALKTLVAALPLACATPQLMQRAS